MARQLVYFVCIISYPAISLSERLFSLLIPFLTTVLFFVAFYNTVIIIVVVVVVVVTDIVDDDRDEDDFDDNVIVDDNDEDDFDDNVIVVDDDDDDDDFPGGDYVKFGFPMAWATWVLNWGFLEFTDAYDATHQTQAMCDMVEWPLDYFLKAWVLTDHSLYVQVC